MKKWVCTVCGYVHEGETAPEKCPVCNAPASKFYLLTKLVGCSVYKEIELLCLLPFGLPDIITGKH